jgi:hypothetical protein
MPVAPVTALAALWACALLFTIVASRDLLEWVHEDEARAASPLRAVAVAVATVAGRTGLEQLGDVLATLRQDLHGRAPVDSPRPTAPPPDSEAPPFAAAPSLVPPSAPDRALRPVRRVLLIGASSMKLALGTALEQVLTARGLEVDRDARVATGLSRPEVLDWQARIEQKLARHRPELVIVNFGGNDATHIPLPKRAWAAFGTEEWDTTYGARVSEFVGRIRAAGARAVMVGMPIMRSDDFSERMKRLNRVTRAATEAAGGVYLDQWDLAATADGEYREHVELDGRKRLMRDPDGIHYSRWGGVFVARALLLRLEMAVPLARAPSPTSETKDLDR